MTGKGSGFDKLAGSSGKGTPPPSGGGESRLHWPVPDDAPPPPRKHYKHKADAVAVWEYRDGDGRLLMAVARFDLPDGGKETPPATYRTDGRGTGWRWKGPDNIKPIFGLDALAARPEAPVLLVEGEKTAVAAQALFPDVVAASWLGGSASVGRVDWKALAGRRVALWPDQDEPGAKAMRTARVALVKLGVRQAAIVELPPGLPDKWDLADDVPAGVDSAALRTALDRALEAPAEAVTTDTEAEETFGGADGWPPRFAMTDKGLWYQPAGDDKAPQLVCGPFEFLGHARDTDGQGWAVVIKFQDRDGREKTAILPRSKFSTFGELRSMLSGMGLFMPVKSPNSADPLAICLNGIDGDHRIMLCAATGWAGSSFILPAGAISPPGAEPSLFLGDAGALHFGQAGDMATWQREVAGRAIGNTRAMFCLSLAFAGPLLKPLGLESGGFHIRGGSSSGKSTLAMLAGTVWGGGGPLGFAQSWRATANGLETIATGHCDTFLALDELAQLAAEEAGQAAYMLSNGMAKARLKTDGTARARAQWRSLFLSTGEISLGDHIKAARNGGNVMAGQELRVIDLQADAGRDLGAWEDVHEFTTGAEFSDALKRISRHQYGHAGPTFVRALVERGQELVDKAKAIEARFLKVAMRDGDTGQIARAASRFAIVAAGGELAAALGIVPWPEDAAFGAALYMFHAWADGFGRSTTREQKTYIDRMASTLLTSPSRFGVSEKDEKFIQDLEAGAGKAKSPRVGESRSLLTLGYHSEHEGEYYYFVHKAGWREIFAGLDSEAAARYLKAAGYLTCDEGRTTKQKRALGQKLDLYWVKPAIMSDF